MMASSLAPLALGAASATAAPAGEPAADAKPGPAQAAGVRLPADATRLRIGFGSCAKQSKPQPIWQAIGEARPDLFLFMGDNLYADAQDVATLEKRYEEFRAVRPLQAFRERVPHLAMWDDHDFGDDDVGGEYPHKKRSQQLFCDEWRVPADSPRRTREGVYEAWRFQVGTRTVQVILPDLRYNRTALVADPKLHQDYRLMVLKARLTGEPMTGWYVPNRDPAATMLGEAQWAWLDQQLSQPADVRIIGSSVQFAAEGTGWEGWANFPLERERLAALLKKHRAEATVLLSGDMHYGDISRLDVPGGYPLWDITSSGLTEVWDVPTPNRNRRSEVLAEVNFGLIDIDFAPAGGAAPAVTLSVCDVQGRVRLQQVLPLDQLRFPATAA